MGMRIENNKKVFIYSHISLVVIALIHQIVLYSVAYDYFSENQIYLIYELISVSILCLLVGIYFLYRGIKGNIYDFTVTVHAMGILIALYQYYDLLRYSDGSPNALALLRHYIMFTYYGSIVAILLFIIIVKLYQKNAISTNEVVGTKK